MKTVEELLRPRYKVSDKWPGMHTEPFHVGQIITLQPHKEEDADGFIYIPDKHMPRSFMWQSFFDLYKNLFQPLPWWSEREISDMPEYVKHVNGSVHKVIAHGDNGARLEGSYWAVYKNLTPATLAEYEQYLQQKGS